MSRHSLVSVINGIPGGVPKHKCNTLSEGHQSDVKAKPVFNQTVDGLQDQAWVPEMESQLAESVKSAHQTTTLSTKLQSLRADNENRLSMGHEDVASDVTKSARS